MQSKGFSLIFLKSNEPFAGRPLLINVGVVCERKRQQQLLAVLESLRDEGLVFDAMFVGTTDLNNPYAKKFLASLEQANRKHGGFEHVSYLDDASFCRLYDRASAMIHFSNEESFGLTFAEAIARGLYLFASDVGAIQEIAKGVKRVQIFNANKWDEMKHAVQKWLSGGGIRGHLVRPARLWNFANDIIRWPSRSGIWRFIGKCLARVHRWFLTGRRRQSTWAI